MLVVCQAFLLVSYCNKMYISFEMLLQGNLQCCILIFLFSPAVARHSQHFLSNKQEFLCLQSSFIWGCCNLEAWIVLPGSKASWLRNSDWGWLTNLESLWRWGFWRISLGDRATYFKATHCCFCPSRTTARFMRQLASQPWLLLNEWGSWLLYMWVLLNRKTWLNTGDEGI